MNFNQIISVLQQRNYILPPKKFKVLTQLMVDPTYPLLSNSKKYLYYIFSPVSGNTEANNAILKQICNYIIGLPSCAPLLGMLGDFYKHQLTFYTYDEKNKIWYANGEYNAMKTSISNPPISLFDLSVSGSFHITEPSAQGVSNHTTGSQHNSKFDPSSRVSREDLIRSLGSNRSQQQTQLLIGKLSLLNEQQLNSQIQQRNKSVAQVNCEMAQYMMERDAM